MCWWCGIPKSFKSTRTHRDTWYKCANKKYVVCVRAKRRCREGCSPPRNTRAHTKSVRRRPGSDFLSRSPNFLSRDPSPTFAKVACRKGDFPWSTWVEAVKCPNRNGIRAFLQRAGADRGVHRREKHVRTQKCAFGGRIRLKSSKFSGRASRALDLSPTFGRRAPNFREISRALGRAQLFHKLSRKSDPGLVRRPKSA